MFHTHKNNLHGIKAALKVYPAIWFHGDGNMYHDEQESEHRKDFANKSDSPQTYRAKFTSADQVPGTVEEMNALLMASKTKELTEAAKPKEVAKAGGFDFEIPEEEEQATEKEKEQAPKKRR